MTRRDPTDTINNVNKPGWAAKCIRRIDRVGWAQFLREEIERPTVLWTRWDPQEELDKWNARKTEPPF